MSDGKIVRLVMRVDQENPSDAVEDFIQNIVENGLREWIYRVEDSETGDVFGYYDGYGNETDMEALLVDAETKATNAEATAEEIPSTMDIGDYVPDKELLALAQELNQGDLNSDNPEPTTAA